MISLCIGRVDPKAGAMQKLIYQTQLPLYLNPIPVSSSGSAPPSSRSGDTNGASISSSTSLFALSEASMKDIMSKMQILAGAMDRHHRQSGGVDERAAVLAWPICLSENASTLATQLERRFQIRVRVLGKDFHIHCPFRRCLPSMATPRVSLDSCSPTTPHPSSAPSAAPSSTTKGSPPRKNLRALLSTLGPSSRSLPRDHATHSSVRAGVAKGQGELCNTTSADFTSSTCAPSSSLQVVLPPPSVKDMEVLAFLSHAVAAQCVAPHRLLVIDEDPQRGIRLVGLNTSAVEDCDDISSGASGTSRSLSPLEAQRRSGKGRSSMARSPLQRADRRRDGRADTMEEYVQRTALLKQAGMPVSTRLPSEESEEESAMEKGEEELNSLPPTLVEHRLPLSVPEAHRLCITTVQHRSPELYQLHRSSPNPVLRTEFIALRDLLEAALTPMLPTWVKRKSLLGGMIGGTSFNGGMLNIAARVAQKAPIPLDHLEVHAEYHFCGLTDVLLAENFPHPGTVLPSAALASALGRALKTPRFCYLPEVTTAVGLLVQPGLWMTAEAFASTPFVQGLKTRGKYEKAEEDEPVLEDMFYRSIRHRTFHRPPIKGNPTAAPTAVWEERRRKAGKEPL